MGPAGGEMGNTDAELQAWACFSLCLLFQEAEHWCHPLSVWSSKCHHFKEIILSSSPTPLWHQRRKKNQAQVDLEMILPQTPPKATRHWNLFWNKLPIKVTKQRGRGDQSFKYGKWHIWFYGGPSKDSMKWRHTSCERLTWCNTFRHHLLKDVMAKTPGSAWSWGGK